MHRRTLQATVVMLALALGGTALAHFHTFWPQDPTGYARPGQTVRWQYFWGHPYEFVVFDARRPTVYAVDPAGDRQPVDVEPVPMTDPETEEERRAFRMSFTPESIGDTWLVMEAPAYAVPEEGAAWQDYVKQCVHVMAEKGWDRRLGLPIELVPLTRPYGIEEGFVFKARAFYDGEPLADALVELEKFNGFHVSEDMLPRDESGNEDTPMITRVARTDCHGYVTYTLDEPGWWMVSVEHEAGEVEVDGETYDRVLRGGLWVPVREKMTLEPPEED